MPLDATNAWIWILAGALVSTLGIILAYRRAGLAAAYVYTGGLLLLAASAFEVHPAFLKPSQPQDVQALQNELARLKRKISLEQNGLVTEETKSARLDQPADANDLASSKAAAACAGDSEKERAGDKALQARIDGHNAQFDSYRRRLLTLSNANKILTEQLEAEKAAHRSALESYQTQKMLLDANLGHLRLLEAEKAALAKQLAAKEQQAAAAPKTAAQPDAQAKAAKALPAFASSQRLGIEKLENNELIQGEIGDYYLISLKDAQTGSPIIFPPAQFIITEKAEQLRSAMDELREAVLPRIPADWQYRIFVRGHADGGSFKEPVGYASYRNLEFLPPSGASRPSYRSELTRKRLDRNFENEDLPNLRGAFIARTLQASVKGELPVLLGNSPDPGRDQADRHADIILLLKRPNS